MLLWCLYLTNNKDVWQQQLHLHDVVMLSFQLMLYFSEGRKHDVGMLTYSNLLADLNRYAISAAGQPLCIYGDPAYPYPKALLEMQF